jgi:hypothetical protein
MRFQLEEDIVRIQSTELLVLPSALAHHDKTLCARLDTGNR